MGLLRKKKVWENAETSKKARDSGIDSTEWVEIKTEEDIKALMDLYGHFEDSVLVQCNIETGNSVNNNLNPEWRYMNRACLLFQREWNNPFSIELLCDEVSRFHFFALEGYTPDIPYAKIIKNNEFYYWAEWFAFDPFNQEHLDLDDFPMIECKRMYYRIVQMTA